MTAEVPELRERPLLTMADMGMNHEGMAGMDHSNMTGADQPAMAGMDHSKMMSGAAKSDPFYAPGSGLVPPVAANGGKFLSYADLKAQKPLYPAARAHPRGRNPHHRQHGALYLVAQ